MSNHLKVELRRLKRSLDGGYGFDLTRYCAGCWTRLGRIFSRGLCCDSCGKRVCKTCRHFVDARLWICVLCYKKK
ncbi:hypothetical protein CDAR_528281 [Caerostris darwini]|uniref:FYVE-type zinc finger domain-containing protein n=1 Tax=Caerostris darwini TaxID=1538125 RepID=A0AAV4P3D9_9ARAC|nr:hypothetical protein CDAR_528281 [Caerostris darwini]